jgi:hypothetical protein
MKKLLTAIAVNISIALQQTAEAKPMEIWNVYPESQESPKNIRGKSCAVYVRSPEKEKVTKLDCEFATVTGTGDRNPYLYFRFLDDYGAGQVFVTKRMQDGGWSEIVAIGKIVDSKIVGFAKTTEGGRCFVNQSPYKLGCLFETPNKKASLAGSIEDYD